MLIEGISRCTLTYCFAYHFYQTTVSVVRVLGQGNWGRINIGWVLIPAGTYCSDILSIGKQTRGTQYVGYQERIMFFIMLGKLTNDSWFSRRFTSVVFLIYHIPAIIIFIGAELRDCSFVDICYILRICWYSSSIENKFFAPKVAAILVLF